MKIANVAVPVAFAGELFPGATALAPLVGIEPPPQPANTVTPARSANHPRICDYDGNGMRAALPDADGHARWGL